MDRGKVEVGQAQDGMGSAEASFAVSQPPSRVTSGCLAALTKNLVEIQTAPYGRLGSYSG